jgi:hypothetical protein
MKAAATGRKVKNNAAGSQKNMLRRFLAQGAIKRMAKARRATFVARNRKYPDL